MGWDGVRKPYTKLELSVLDVEAVIPNISQHMLALGALSNNQFVSVYCKRRGIEMQ